MTEKQPWYVGERGEHIVIMLLTRIPALRVTEVGERDHGIDFFVHIGGGEAPGRIFGVNVKAATSMQTLVNSHGLLRASRARHLQRLVKSYTFPIGLFAVDATDGTARFGWLLAPAISPLGGRRLHPPERVDTIPVNDDTLEQIVNDVSAWYDASSSTAKAL